MQISELVIILLFYHVSSYDCFKHYYCEKYYGSIKGKDFTTKLEDKGIQMITMSKKGMKNVLMDLDDKMLLLKGSLIETVIGKIRFLGKFEQSLPLYLC